MPTRVQTFSSSISQGIMPLSRASTTHSISSDTEPSDSMHIINPEARIIEITTQPDFYIFTSLLWTRTSCQNLTTSSMSGKPAPQPPESKAGMSKTGILDDFQPELGLLPYHRDRLIDTAEALRWRHIQVLERTEYSVGILRASIAMYLQSLPVLLPGRAERRKLKLMINKLGTIRVDSTVIDCLLERDVKAAYTTFLPYTLELDPGDDLQHPFHGRTAHDQKLSQVYLDTSPSRPSLFTTYKTSHRSQYNRARARASVTTSPPTDEEVLIYNKNGEIMEASLCTVYFYKHGKWITPAAICGGNLGVTRRLALEKGLCTQGTIGISEIQDGERIWLSNAARGFFLGKITLERRNPLVALDCGASP